jgi:hypothetical protein
MCEHVFVPRWSPPDAFSYSYLLGVYLGDGCLSVRPGNRGAQLVVACDAAYPGLIDESWAAIVLTSANPTVSRVRLAASAACGCSLPGRDGSWRFPSMDLAASTSARSCSSHGSKRSWIPIRTRWFFSNRSDDIRGLFCATCDAVGIRWTQSNHRNISVSHRRSVALLDEWVGPKR